MRNVVIEKQNAREKRRMRIAVIENNKEGMGMEDSKERRRVGLKLLCQRQVQPMTAPMKNGNGRCRLQWDIGQNLSRSICSQ